MASNRSKRVLCSVEGCGHHKAIIKGLCAKHYERKKRLGATDLTPPPTVAEIMDERVSKGPGCWEWQRRKVGLGYGIFRYAGGYLLAHRAAWEIANGPVPDGLIVRHTCDNPPCCNPEHLLVGTHKDNSDDKVARGRASWQTGNLGRKPKTHCKSGHLLEPTNVIYVGGRRTCLTCRRETQRAYRERQATKANTGVAA